MATQSSNNIVENFMRSLSGLRNHRIRIIRVVTQIIFFFVFNGVFLGLARIPQPVPVHVPPGSPFATVWGGFSALQYTLAQGQFPFLVIGMFFLTGIVFGRIFCGWACPVGFWQDILAIFPIKRTRVSKEDNNAFKYLALFFVVLSIFLVILTGFARLRGDAVSIDIANQLPFDAFDPAGVLFGSWFFILNWEVLSLDGSFFSSLAVLEWFVIVKILIFVIVTFISMKIPRAYCRYICPTGAVLGLCSKYSGLTIKNKGLQNAQVAHNASASCPMDVPADSFTENGITDSHCILCGNCVDAEPENLSFGIRKSN